MPARLAASMMVTPSATSICFPSMLISSGMVYASPITRHSNVVGHEAFLVLDVVHEFVPEMLDEALHRQRRSIAQRADGAAGDVVGDVVEKVEVLEPALAVLDPVHHAVEPAGALAAGRALPAGLLEIEIRQAQQ